MKIHINIANGDKRGKLQKWFQENPDANVDVSAREDAIRSWADARYGGWLSANDITDYVIYAITSDNFRIDFLHDTDAEAFMRACGGSKVEE